MTSEMCHLVKRTAILSQNHRIRDKMLPACTSRGATCTAKQGELFVVQTQNFIFGRFSNFFFYPNETLTHPPTSNFFWIFGKKINFAKPLSNCWFLPFSESYFYPSKKFTFYNNNVDVVFFLHQSYNTCPHKLVKLFIMMYRIRPN